MNTQQEQLKDAVHDVIRGDACFVHLTAPQISILINTFEQWMMGCDDDCAWGDDGVSHESCIELLEHLKFAKP